MNKIFPINSKNLVKMYKIKHNNRNNNKIIDTIIIHIIIIIIIINLIMDNKGNNISIAWKIDLGILISVRLLVIDLHIT